MKKRLLALAVAGASAVVLGGAFSLTTHTTRVSASSPVIMVVGCAQANGGANNPDDIEFPSGALDAGGNNAAQITGPQEQPFIVVGTTGQLILNAINLNAAGGVNGSTLTIGNYLECGAIMQDAAPALAPPPVGINDQDNFVNTVDQGTVVYTLANAGGRFAILNNQSNVISLPCAATAPGVTITAAAPPPNPFTSDQCQGAQSVTVTRPGGAGFAVVPNPALEIKVGFASGVPLSSFGNLTGIVGVNFGFGLTATYQRDPTLSSQLALALATNAGPNLTQTNVGLGLLVPTYYMSLTANPTTIFASPNLTANNSGVAQGGNTGGSTITASMFTGAQPLTVGLTGGVTITVGTTTVAGSEPGTITFVTNNGIFGSPSAPAASAQQTVAVACGVLPGSNLVFNPTTFSFGNFSFNSCTSATTTLFGGGAAGTATVVATFVGSITGQQAQNAVAVAFSPTPNVANLVRGCNEEITPASLAGSTPIATYLGTVAPSSVVVSIWQYNNATQGFNALYFSTPGAPVNGTTVGGNQSVFICASSSGTVGNGAF